LSKGALPAQKGDKERIIRQTELVAGTEEKVNDRPLFDDPVYGDTKREEGAQ
jgi:hypothetical protein